MPRRRGPCSPFWILGLRLSLWLVLLLASALCAAGQTNVSISNTASQIVYTPFLCNASSLSFDPDCSGAWNPSSIAGIPTVSTTGPSPDGANIVPQMFLSFRASALYMSTSVLSNATANFTVASPAGGSVSRVVDSSAGLVALINLVETDLTTLTVTFIPSPDDAPTQLDIGSILITVPDPDATTSFLPSMTLPPSITLPTFVPPSTSPSSSASPSATAQRALAHRAQIAEALSLVLGLGVGLSVIAGALFFWWRRRRRIQAARQAWF